MIYLWIGAGSALGGMARYALSGLVAARFGETFPWGTITVNVLGSFLIGLFFTLTGPEGRWLVAPEVRQGVSLGLIGGFTTFSSFSLQTLNLFQDGEWLAGSANVALSVALCLAGVYLGYLAGLAINR